MPPFFETADIFLQFLYEQNVICYIEVDEASERSEPFIRWCFRERSLSNLSPKVRTHVEYEVFYALTKALNVGRPIKIKREKFSREIGTLIRLDDKGQFGFIRGGPNQAEFYFKYDQVVGLSRKLKIGARVSFEIRVKYAKVRAEVIELMPSKRQIEIATKSETSGVK